MKEQQGVVEQEVKGRQLELRSERGWDPRSIRATVRTLSFILSEVENHRA